MGNKIINLAKNTSYFTLALILQKVISFTYFAILARNLAPDDLGKYYLALSITTIFSIFIDLGLSNVLVREVAKRQDEAKKLLGNVLSLKFILGALSWLSVILLVNVLGYPQITKHLVYISSIAMIIDSFILCFWSTIRGFHNLKYESIGVVVYQLITLGVGLFVLRAGLGLKWLMSAMIFASTFNIIFSFLLLNFKFKIPIRPFYGRIMIRSIIAISVPFALYGIFYKVYLYLDTVLLSHFAGDYYVGLYQIAFKIVFALQFLPLAFVASLYPAFSDYWKNNKEQLVITFERAINYLIIISFPIVFGLIIISKKIVVIFKPEYMAAVPALRIMVMAVIFIFLNYPVGALLNACDRQKRNTIHMGVTLAASIALNLVLIPKYSIMGAAITVVISNMLLFTLNFSLVPQIIKYRSRKIFIILLKVLLASLMMSWAVFYLKDLINIFIVIILAAFIYGCLLLLMKAIKKEDLVSIYGTFVKK